MLSKRGPIETSPVTETLRFSYVLLFLASCFWTLMCWFLPARKVFQCSRRSHA
jgi:hypothetical protein